MCLIQGDNFTARHGDFHIILTLVYMGTRPTRLDQDVMLKLGKALQNFHQNGNITFGNFIFPIYVSKQVHNLCKLAHYYGFESYPK